MLLQLNYSPFSVKVALAKPPQLSSPLRYSFTNFFNPKILNFNNNDNREMVVFHKCMYGDKFDNNPFVPGISALCNGWIQDMFSDT